jgi:hypothetical protein
MPYRSGFFLTAFSRRRLYGRLYGIIFGEMFDGKRIWI